MAEKSRMRIVDGRLKNRSCISVHAKFVRTIVTTVISWAVFAYDVSALGGITVLVKSGETISWPWTFGVP